MKSRSQQALSRRAALKGGVASTVLWPACFRARAAERQELSFVVVTDTHLGYRNQESAAKLWHKTALEINDAPGELVLHLGDIVDGGREEQYPIYLETRGLINKRVHEVGGNHDPEDLFRKYIREEVSTVVEHSWLRFLLVNNARRDSHDGFLLPEQLYWLRSRCEEAVRDDQLVCICMHVPAHWNRHPDRAWYVKPGSGHKEFGELLDRFKDQLVLVAHGHFHNGIRGWNDRYGVHEICFPSALYNQNRGLEEKAAPGFNPGEFRAGYTLVTIREGTMRLRYKPIGDEVSLERQCDMGRSA
ncbi:MAG: metallophosphoesterase [Planctomycetaceae bacterium]|nr:metallophosphoesterase [Planctomycetales bacterium]MCB9923966.1 metallophosphoesterase [Planctomycetaceae bacterium]